MACGRLLKYWPEAENLAVAVAATVAVEARYEEDGAARDRKDDDEVFPLGSLPSCSSRLTSLRVIWRHGSYGDHLACIVEGGGDSYRFCGSDGQVLVLRLLEKM